MGRDADQNRDGPESILIGGTDALRADPELEAFSQEQFEICQQVVISHQAFITKYGIAPNHVMMPRSAFHIMLGSRRARSPLGGVRLMAGLQVIINGENNEICACLI